MLHTYYEKPIKTQKVLEKHSVMSKKQKYCILSEEVTRRLYNVAEEEENEEVEKILDGISKQLKNSLDLLPSTGRLLAAGPYNIIPNHTVPYGTIQDHM